MIGLLLLNTSTACPTRASCERWCYDPYFQHFTGFEFFQQSALVP